MASSSLYSYLSITASTLETKLPRLLYLPFMKVRINFSSNKVNEDDVISQNKNKSNMKVNIN